MINIEKAMLNPSSEFSHPEDVLKQKNILKEQQVAILQRWEYDARELSVAEEENMTGGPPNMLTEILDALHKLGVDKTGEHSPPTKQG